MYPPREIACLYCSKRFVSIQKNPKYCSHECAQLAQRKRINVVCEQCGITFTVKDYRKDEVRFCSRSCGGKWAMSHRKMVNPNLKGNQHAKGSKSLSQFTSERVRGANNPKWVEPIEAVCKQCGSVYYGKPWEFKDGRKKFCSKECRYQYLTGENSPLWLGGETHYRGKDWVKIRRIVVENQQGICADCGKFVGVRLPVHHIKPFRQYQTAEEANRLENLIGLCQSCHMKREPRLRMKLS